MSQTWCRTRMFLRQFHSGKTLYRAMNRHNLRLLRASQTSDSETLEQKSEQNSHNKQDIVPEQTRSNQSSSAREKCSSSKVETQNYRNRHVKQHIDLKQTRSDHNPSARESGASNNKEKRNYRNKHDKRHMFAAPTHSNTTSDEENSASNTVEQADIDLLEKIEADSRVPLIAKYLSKSDHFSDSLKHGKVDLSEIKELPESLKSIKDLQKSLEELELDLKKLRAVKEELLKDPSRSSSESSSKQGKEVMKKKKTVLWGTPDPKHPVSEVPCGGCGAMLHCQDTGIPGYVPQEKFKVLSVEDLETTLCQRCHCLTNNQLLIDIEADANLYKTIIKRIRMEKALVLMVVDVTDITNSIIHGFVDQVGRMTSVIVLGNKVDLIPKDGEGYLRRLRDKIWEECLRAELNPRGNNIRDVRLISAKTGYGIEELITKLVSYWELKGNVYLVGTTNSGKSTLFNTFLESDYCKFSCRDILQRATVSRWPGTTLNLIKFPIVKMRTFMAGKRQARLENDYALLKSKKENRKDMLLRYGRSSNAILIGTVGKTEFRTDHAIQRDQETFLPTGQQFTAYNPNLGPDVKSEEIEHNPLVRKKDILFQRRVVSEADFPDSVWTYDTPGLINEDQLINFLTPEELKLVLTRLMIRPRVFVMQPGDTMFVTGLSRIDYLDGQPNTPFAVFTGHMLPVHIVKQSEADDFYRDNVGTETLGVPLGDSERLARLPSLAGREFSFTTYNEDHFMLSADLQLSSLGWLSVGGKNKHVTLRAYTPSGRGLHLRQPALLPNLRAFMGDRKRGTKSYNIRKLRP